MSDMKRFRDFLNDDDGFSAKDFLMVLFGTLFALMIATAFIVSIVGVLTPATIAVIQLLDGTMITIVGGVFGLQGIKEFKKVSASVQDTTQEIEPVSPQTYEPPVIEPIEIPAEPVQDSAPKLP